MDKDGVLKTLLIYKLVVVLFSFFPARLSPFISLSSNVVFAILVRLRICRQPQRKYDVSSPTTITVTLPGASAQEVERRRSDDIPSDLFNSIVWQVVFLFNLSNTCIGI